MRAALGLAAAAFALVAYEYLTLPDVRVLAKTNPVSTAFMDLRTAEAAREGRTLRKVHRWVPYSRISASLKRAVLVAEDSAFWDHEGVDMEQIRASIQAGWEQGREIRGASTITQQLAKNLYLSPSRDPLRKLRELIIARRLEAALPKTRIFEIYLNVIEWGDGIWGAEAAAQRYFGIPSASLNREQAALLAGAIINPRLLNPARPTRRLLRRQRIILGRMGQVALPAPTRATSEVAEPADTASTAILEAAPTIAEPGETEAPADAVPEDDALPAENPPATLESESPPA
ncbi:MAG: monofunctional biosynthetic peptidoglycan transglycosylase [Acidobacteria bacterium]|nr:monofunctional biosynthetic peptidoglycan transglycosylase [Acidobacteriota bacterium]